MISTNLARGKRPCGHLTQQTRAVGNEPGDVGGEAFEINMSTAALLKLIKIKTNNNKKRSRSMSKAAK